MSVSASERVSADIMEGTRSGPKKPAPPSTAPPDSSATAETNAGSGSVSTVETASLSSTMGGPAVASMV